MQLPGEELAGVGAEDEDGVGGGERAGGDARGEGDGCFQAGRIACVDVHEGLGGLWGEDVGAG